MVAKRITSSNMYKWFRGLSVEFGRAESYLNSIVSGFDLRTSAELISEHEQRVGLPDKTFPTGATEDIRRYQAMIKLAAEGVTIVSDYEYLCFDVGGLYVSVYPGMDFYSASTVPSFSSDGRVDYSNSTNDPDIAKKEARFTIVFEIDFSQSSTFMAGDIWPVSWPWNFGLNSWNTLTNFLLEIIPANVNAQFIYAGTFAYGFGHGPFGHTFFGGTP
jgi:hypothetical protein